MPLRWGILSTANITSKLLDSGTDQLSAAELPFRPDYCFVDGEHTVYVCTNISCSLLGADDYADGAELVAPVEVTDAIMPGSRVLVIDDVHFLAVARYIERNPLRANLVEKAASYRVPGAAAP